jgi:hypothetical protein
MGMIHAHDAEMRDERDVSILKTGTNPSEPATMSEPLFSACLEGGPKRIHVRSYGEVHP